MFIYNKKYKMYSHKLKKVNKSKLRNKRDVVNNTRGSYKKHSKHSNNAKHSKNSKNTKNSKMFMLSR
jgi:hypothetical protein